MNLINKSAKGLSAALAIGLLSATAAYANTVDVTSITGSWTSADPAAAVSGVGSTTISWGDPAPPNTQQSSYVFTAAGTPIEGIAPNTTFSLGTFTHNNFPIFAPSLEAATLGVDIGIQIGALSDSISAVFDFLHDETPNSTPCAPDSVSVCDDVVTVTTNTTLSETFSVGGVTYIFELLGFCVTCGEEPTLLTSFLTQEGASNTATLLARYTVAPVPLPAAGWMLLAGIGGLAALRRRQKRADV